MPKTYQKYAERELPMGSPIRMSLDDGSLNPACVGWSRQPVQVDNTLGYALRKKRWNYCAVVTPACLFSITLSNVDYMGLVFAYFLDFKTKKFIEKTVMSPFGKNCVLPPTVEGDIRFEHKDLSLRMTDSGSAVEIHVSLPDFGGQKTDAVLHIQRPQGLESLNVMIPWSDTRYHFTSKQNCLPAGGSVKIGAQEYFFLPVRDFACLDYGRGIWKYKSFWNWSSFSVRSGADVLGVNLGAGWTDGANTTENSLLINGKLQRLAEDVAFEYDPADFMKPWRLRSTFSPAVDLTFTPFYERVAKTDFAVLRSEVHQMIGKFNGTLTALDGSAYPVTDAIGWAEEHNARW